MKRVYLRGVLQESRPDGHRFPLATLLISVCLLGAGLRLADVLPTPSLPRLARAPLAQAAVLGGDSLQFSPNAAAPIPGRAPGAAGERPPGETITAADVRFQPIQVPMGPFNARIRAVASKGRVVLSDVQNGSIVWSGPVHDARFVCSDIAASRALKDFQGKTLWSETPVPDLCLSRDADGRTRLWDRQGRTLWQGTLELSPRMGFQPSRSERRRTGCSVDFNGIKVRGINGFFTVMDDSGRDTRVLWSGTLPGNGQPTLLLRDQHRFFFWGDRDKGPVTSSDRVTTIEMREEPGLVTITDPEARIVGRKVLPLLNVTSAIQLVGEERTLPIPSQFYVPLANLTKEGCALFTYRDQRGNVVMTNSVVRDGERQRLNSNQGQAL